MHIRSIIIPAVGSGTHLLPATRVVPAELLTVYDRPVLQFAIDEAIDAGAERIIVVIHPDKLWIRDYLKPDETGTGRLGAGGRATRDPAAAAVQAPAAVDLVFAFQNRPLGLGHAISICSALVLPGPVGVILPDDVIMGTPCMAEMAQAYRGGHMVAAMTVTAQDAPHSGVFRPLGTPSGQCVAVSGIVETPPAGTGTGPWLLAAVGRYVLDPMIFATLRGLPQYAAPAGRLMDAIAEDAASVPLTAFRFRGRRHDCASPDGLIEAGLARQRAVKRARSPTTGTARLTARINDWPAAARWIDAQTAALEGIAP